MPKSVRNCEACRINIKNMDLMICSRCKSNYHYACLSYNDDVFRNFSPEFKNSWVCPSCRCSETKRGDNTNTPVRVSEMAASPSPSAYSNVTLRSKTRPPGNCSCLSAESIRDIIREELRISSSIQLREISDRISAFEQSINFLSEQFDKIKSESDTLKTEVLALRKENASLQATTTDLSSRLRQFDQQSRASNLEINCIPEHKNENIKNVILQLAKCVKCPINDKDLYYVSRTAKQNPSSSRPRSVLVRFSTPNIRDNLLAACIKFNKHNPKEKLNTSHLGLSSDKPTPVYVTENLSPENKSLHALARQKAKELDYKFVWVRDGRIFMRKNQDSKYVWIRNTDSLSNLTL